MKKSINCLMLQTTDKRCFFTYKNNFPQLIEFAKTCGAEISVVKTQDAKIEELEDLAKSICNYSKTKENPQYEIVEVKLPNIKIKKPLKTNEIIDSIKKLFLDNEIVSIKNLENKFFDSDVSKTTYCRHISCVRKKLIKDGYEISKIGHGKYQLKK